MDVELTNSNILDRRLINSPTFAESQMVQQTIKMAEYAKENVKLSFNAFLENNLSDIEKIKFNEEYINYMGVQLSSFLVKLSATEATEKQQEKLSACHNMIMDIEKVGDMAENITELAEEARKLDVEMSDDAKEELKAIYSYVLESLNICIDSFKNADKNLASTIFDIEDHINSLEKEYRNMHIKRLNKGKCSPNSGILYLEALSNLERIGDHATNICESVVLFLD